MLALAGARLMTQYRKKPLLVDAVPVDDILESNPVPEWVTEAMTPVDETDEGYGAIARVRLVPDGVDIITKQSQVVHAGSGEWLLRAAPDDLWPIDGDVFEASYERPEDGEEPPLKVWTLELDRAVAHIQNAGRMLGHPGTGIAAEVVVGPDGPALGFDPEMAPTEGTRRELIFRSLDVALENSEAALALANDVETALLSMQSQPWAPEDLNGLLQTTDAATWADAFVAEFGHRLGDINSGLMIAWFANAIETGRSYGIAAGS